MSRTNYGGPWLAQQRSDRKLFDCSRLVGVEWEFNSASGNSLVKWKEKWGGQVISDGSCGQEAVTPPAAGDHLIRCLTDLGAAFVADNAPIDERCGVHVHIDASDVSWHDMARLIKTYAHVEPILYLLAGQGRITNRYCVPCGDSFVKAMNKLPATNDLKVVEDKIRRYEKRLAMMKLPPMNEHLKESWRSKINLDAMKSGILEVAFGQNSQAAREHIRARPGKKDGSRYKGLNLCPWLAGRRIKAKDTTIEFRLHRNVKGNDASRVINWAKVCARLVDWSVRASDQDVNNLPKSALKSLCNIIAPECKPYILERLKLWRVGTSIGQGTKRRIYLDKGKYMMRLKD